MSYRRYKTHAGRLALASALASGMLLTACFGARAQSVQGAIADEYAKLGGASGPLGKVLTNEMPTPDGRGTYNQFQHGMIAVTPGAGARTTQVAYREPGKVTFLWGPTDPYGYDRFIIRWSINNGPESQEDFNGQGLSGSNFSGKASRSDGKFTLNIGDRDSAAFKVEGADKGTFNSVARQGWMAQVWVGSSPGAPASAPIPPVISVASTGANSTAAFTMKGTGFKPSTSVTIRVVDDALQTLTFHKNSTASGLLSWQQPIPVIGGFYLHFSATDNRSNPQDPTGSLWSNTVTIIAPGGGGTADTTSMHRKRKAKQGALDLSIRTKPGDKEGTAREILK